MQSEYGDIYKVSLDYKEETVTEVRVKYFDTLPSCASICVLKTGFLFAASEFGNHNLYQFAVRLADSPIRHFAVFASSKLGAPNSGLGKLPAEAVLAECNLQQNCSISQCSFLALLSTLSL